MLAAAPLPQPIQSVSVTIDGQPYSGAAPGEVAGVLQIDAAIPDQFLPRDHPRSGVPSRGVAGLA